MRFYVFVDILFVNWEKCDSKHLIEKKCRTKERKKIVKAALHFVNICL